MKYISRYLCGGSSVAILSISCLAMSLSAHAQDNAGESGAGEIVVTGSRITNPNLKQASPVAVIGEEEIALRQSSNAADLVRDMPGVSAGINSSVNDGSTGFSSFNLRGLGSNRNLVLIDGSRIVPADLTGVTDLNNIPVSLIERTDVVTGGASSVYGADAVAGVLNFITKRNFSGVDLSTSMGITEQGDGRRLRTDLTVGGNFDDGRGNAVVSIGYQKVDAVLQGARPSGQDALYIDGTPVGSGTAVPTRLNGRQYDPETGALVPTYSSYNFTPTNYYQTPMKRYNAFASARYEITDAVEVYAKAMFNRTTVSLQLAPSGLFGDTYQLPLNNPFLTSAIHTQLCATNGIADCATAIASGVEVPTAINRRLVEMGPRQREYVTNMFQFWAGARGKITDLIKFDISGSYGESEKTQTLINYGLKSRIQQALRASSTTTCSNTSNGCSPINLFGSGEDVSAETIAFINAPAVSSIKTSISILNASFSGDLTDKGFLWADTPIGIAGGVEYRKYTAGQQSDASLSTQDEVSGSGTALVNFSGQYNVKEAFAELIIPVIEQAPLIRSLTIEAGARLSDYSTAGTTTTWKAGGSWEPVGGVRLRGIYQRAVRAPNIAELYNPATIYTTNLTVDPCAGSNPVGNATLTAICIAQGAPASSIGSILQPSAGQINTTNGGNVDLKPEKAGSYTLGIALTPSQIPGLSITADYFHIKVKDAITTPTASDILDPCYVSGNAQACSLVSRNPLNGSLNGGGDTGGLILQLTNQGTLITSGIDLHMNYHRATGFGGLNFDVNGTWTREFKFQASPTSVMRECVGQYGVDCDPIKPEFSFNARATATIDNIGDFSLLWRWIDGVRYQNYDAAKAAGVMLDEYLSIPAYSYFDFTYRAKVNETFGFTLSIENIADKKPPIVSNYVGTSAYNSGNTYPSTYDVLGRRYMLTTSIKF